MLRAWLGCEFWVSCNLPKCTEAQSSQKKKIWCKVKQTVLTNCYNNLLWQVLSVNTDGTRATVTHSASPRYSTQNWALSAINSRHHRQSTGDHTSWPPWPSPPGAMNNRPTAVYIGLVNDRQAATKFSKSRVWNKVPGGKTLIFGDTQFPYNTV